MMIQADNRALVREATDYLTRALAILDELEQHVAAAELDHVIELLQGRSESDLGR